MRLIVSTQVQENYGAHSWDGKGECPQYWKNKFGSDYEIACLSPNQIIEMGSRGLEVLVGSFATAIEEDNDSFKEWVIGFELLEDTEQTDMEKSYEEYQERYASVRLRCPIVMEIAPESNPNQKRSA